MASMKHLFLYTTLHFILTHSTTDTELLLLKIKPSLRGTAGNLLLNSWDISVPLCQWRGLKWAFTNGTSLQCTDLNSSPQWSNISHPILHLISLHVPSENLTGTLPKEIGEFPNLQTIDLSMNALSGPIPLELGYSSCLSDIDLSHNLLDGLLPVSIWSLCGQPISLKLHGNALSGNVPNPPLPDDMTCKNLVFLDLGDNRFSGKFPEFIIRISGLKELDLGGNMLSGPIPDGISGLRLERLNLSYNNFSGILPESRFGVEVFEGNGPNLCGPPLEACKAHGLSPGAMAGLVIGLMTGTVVLVSLLIGYFHGKRKRDYVDEDEEDFHDVDDDDEDDEETGGSGSDGKLVVFEGGEHLTLDNVLNATGQVVEESCYGTMYKARQRDGGAIALRLLRKGCCMDGSSCLGVIKQLGCIRHKNLVPLRAFYRSMRGEKLLMYDYVPSRSLYDLLRETRPVLNWPRRHKIAIGIARGLAHLHNLKPPITHGNMSSRTILIDNSFIPRLSEFGLHKMMIPSVVDQIMAHTKTDGYKAPELRKTSKCNTKSDVYAFGIVLLEILVGKRAAGEVGFVDLPTMVKVGVLEEATMEVFDEEILKGVRNNVMEEGVLQALKVAMGCCAPVGYDRPTMEEVVRQLEESKARDSCMSEISWSGSVTSF